MNKCDDGNAQKRMMAESVGMPSGMYIRKPISLASGKDYGADPRSDGQFTMVPSGDVVSLLERNRRLGSP